MENENQEIKKDENVFLRVWGDYACFTRPEFRSERVSYEIMTPAAARGILTAIYWKPEFEWKVDAIHVLNPINFISIKRNELGCKTSLKSKAPIDIREQRQQRYSRILKNVEYVIKAHVNPLKPLEGVDVFKKHSEMFKRRAEKGQCFRTPCFGIREFTANFALLDSEKAIPPSNLQENYLNANLGRMLQDVDYIKNENGKVRAGVKDERYDAIPHFFEAVLHNGILEVPSTFVDNQN